MTTGEIKAAVFRSLGRIAPEADLSALDPTAEIRDQLDIDSFDFLTFIIGLDESLGVAVPESDYPQLATVDGAVTYLDAALAAAPTAR